MEYKIPLVNSKTELLCEQIEVKLKDIENGKGSEVDIIIELIEKLKNLDLEKGVSYNKRLEEGLRSTKKWFFQLEQESLSKSREDFVRVQEKMKTVKSIIDDCAGTVINQSEIIDRIDWQVDSTLTTSKKAFFEVEIAKNSQKSCKACTKFTLLAALILTILIFFLFILT